MHGHFNDTLPNRFNNFFHEVNTSHTYNTRAARNRNYTTISCRTSRGQRSIRFYGPKIWNNIPLPHRNLSKLKFKKECKIRILSNY